MQDDVTSAADKLMKALLDKAQPCEDIDFSVQVMQAATRYLAVKSRINLPEEGNAFDGWRTNIGGSDDGAGAADGRVRTAAGSSGATDAPPAKRRRRQRATDPRAETETGPAASPSPNGRAGDIATDEPLLL